MTQPITLWKLRSILKKCKKNTGGALMAQVLFFVGKEEYDLDCIGQFHIKPDVTITLKRRRTSK